VPTTQRVDPQVPIPKSQDTGFDNRSRIYRRILEGVPKQKCGSRVKKDYFSNIMLRDFFLNEFPTADNPENAISKMCKDISNSRRMTLDQCQTTPVDNLMPLSMKPTVN
jgi:hypothetical protein